MEPSGAITDDYVNCTRESLLEEVYALHDLDIIKTYIHYLQKVGDNAAHDFEHDANSLYLNAVIKDDCECSLESLVSAPNVSSWYKPRAMKRLAQLR